MSIHLDSTFILITHWIIIISLSIRVIKRRPPVGVSMAWLAVIFSATRASSSRRRCPPEYSGR